VAEVVAGLSVAVLSVEVVDETERVVVAAVVVARDDVCSVVLVEVSELAGALVVVATVTEALAESDVGTASTATRSVD
jgi:hypothetical protein